MTKVAVCLAAYNGRKWLNDQIESILNQKGVEVSIFVSVDSSSDGTEEFIDVWSERDSRVILLPVGLRFGGAARNFFRLLKDVEFASFDYVSLADQDDIWHPEKLLRAHHTLRNMSADGYSSNVEAFWESGKRIVVNKSQPQRRWDFLFEAAGPGCTYVMRTQLAQEIQTFLRRRYCDAQEVGLHDWFSYAFARAKGYRWVIDDYVGMLYRQHDENQVGVNRGVRAFAYRCHKVLNGWGLGQAALIAQLVGLGDDLFVKKWLSGSRFGALWLVLNATQCRRRARDRVLFALACAVYAIVGRRAR